MNELPVVEALRHASTALRQAEVDFVVAGGMAVSAITEPRFTSDVDLVVDVPDDERLEALHRSLLARGFRPDGSRVHENTGRLAMIRFCAPNGVIIDVLSATTGVEPEIVADARHVETLAGQLPIASVESLVAMKVLSCTEYRLKDRADFNTLLEFHPNLDLERVRSLLDQMEARGYAREQDLQAKLAQMLAELA